MSALEVFRVSASAQKSNGVSVPVLADVFFTVDAGQLVAVVGESGAGKTMTMLSILGLEPRGISVVGGLRLGERTFDLSRSGDLRELRGNSIGMVLQNPGSMFDPVMRIGNQLVESVVRRKSMKPGAATERARALMQQVGFTEPQTVLNLYPHQLSGGMLQRAALAMTLMPSPMIIIADEPTSALDANLRSGVFELFRKLAREFGVGVIIVTHDLGLVQRFADRVVVMYSGRVVEEGAVGDVFLSPEHPYTRALLDCTLGLDDVGKVGVSAIPGTAPRVGSWPVGCSFWPRCPQAVDACKEREPEWKCSGGRGVRCHLSSLGEAEGVHFDG